MNLSKRQIVIKNQVLFNTHLINDLCNIVAEYVFPNAFRMKLKTRREFEASNWKEAALKVFPDLNYVLDNQNGKSGCMNGKEYVSIIDSVFCNAGPFGPCREPLVNSTLLINLKSRSKWIGKSEEFKEVYFITDKGLIRTINEKGEEPLLWKSVV